MNIIDVHVNVTPDGRWFGSNLDASVTALMGEMGKAGADKAVLISLPFASTNSHIASLIKETPDKFKGFGHLNFTKTNLINQVDEILAMGFSGIKIHPRFQGINLCHPFFDPLWDYFNKKKLTVLVDGYYGQANSVVPISALLPLNYEMHLMKYRNITFILAHAGFHKVMDTLFLCTNYPNFYCDISYSLNLIEKMSCYKDYRFLIEQCDKKVFFGSDFPEASILKSKKDFLKLTKGLPKEKIENAARLNALKLFWMD